MNSVFNTTGIPMSAVPLDSDILFAQIRTQVTLFNGGDGAELGIALEIEINYKNGKKPRIFNHVFEVPK